MVETLTTLELNAVEQGPVFQGVAALRFRTDAGFFDGLFHEAPPGSAAVVWMNGGHAELAGPASGMYPRLAGRLAETGIASLRLAYRDPEDLEGCALDALVAVVYLESLGRSRVALVGYSFGGAVAISAGVETPNVVAVATLSSQTHGTGAVGYLSPRPLLLLHGTEDAALPVSCSRDLYSRAREPKEMRLYPGSGHGLDECREEVDRDLLAWLRRVLR